VQLRAEGGQVEEEVLSLLELDRGIAAALVRVDQVDRVQLVATVVALIAARVGEAADRAFAFDVSIRQRPPADRVESAHLRLLDQVALLVKLEEQVLRDLVMVGGRRAREDVVGHPQAAQVLDDQGAVLVDELPRRDALLVRLVRDRSAVLISTTRHQHARTAQPLEAREHVGGHGKARHMTDVARAVGIRPRRRDKDSSAARLHGSQG